MMNDYHIRKLDDGSWIVSCMEESKKGEMGKNVEYSYHNLDDALEDIKNGFSDEPKEEDSEPESPAPGIMKKIMRGDDE